MIKCISEQREKTFPRRLIFLNLIYHIGFIFFVFLTLNRSAEAYDESIITFVENVNINLDGSLNESIWNTDPLITSLYQLCPNEGEEPSELTEMWLFYDKNYIYVGVRLYVKDTSTIVTRTLERDSHSPDQDAIAIILDTLNDNRTAYGFLVSPAGVRTDIAIYNDAENPRSDPWNKDWNAFWDAETVQNEEGWSTELRIPFSSLRFETCEEGVTMGLILWRYLARNVEYNVFPEIHNNWKFSAYKPSQSIKVKFEGIKSKHPLYIRPYVLSGFDHQNELDDMKGKYKFQNSWMKEIGLDLKYKLTSNLILDVTLNTDFAQVEVDDQQINLTRFSLFFPEKRTFFQERADLFGFSIPGGQQLLFHSRTIGIVSGENIPILGGARLTGRIGDWEVGFLEMQTSKTDIDSVSVPSENFGVFRLKRQVMDDGSYIGSMLTSRTDFNGNYSFIYAADIDLCLKGANYFRFQAAHSTEPGSEPEKSFMGTILFNNRIRRGFSYGSSITHIGSQFHPALGFLFRRGINRSGNKIGYTWFPKISSPIQSHGIESRLEYIWNTDSGLFETFTGRLGWNAIFRSGATAKFELKVTKEDLNYSFNLSDVIIDPGSYSFTNAEANYESPSGMPFRLGIKAIGGEYYGGWQVGCTLSPSLTLSSHLMFKVDYNYSMAEVLNGVYEAHVARFRIRSAFNRMFSVSAFIQYNSDFRQISTNFRFRYNPAEGVDLYVVYNEALNTDLNYQIPSLPLTQARVIMIKFNYTFVY